MPQYRGGEKIDVLAEAERANLPFLCPSVFFFLCTKLCIVILVFKNYHLCSSRIVCMVLFWSPDLPAIPNVPYIFVIHHSSVSIIIQCFKGTWSGLGKFIVNFIATILKLVCVNVPVCGFIFYFKLFIFYWGADGGCSHEIKRCLFLGRKAMTNLKVKVLVCQLCPTLCNPMDCSLLSSFVYEILQVRILEWVAIPFSKGSFWPRDQTWVSCIAGKFITIWATRKAPWQT